MRSFIVLIGCCIALQGVCQQDSTAILTPSSEKKKEEKEPARIFMSTKTINANTVNMIGRGILEFKVVHNFGDLAGSGGGVKNFFGIDNAQDIRIGFQYGLSKRVNLIASRYKGATQVQRLYELGFKWLVAEQREKDPSHPLSIALFANAAVATMKAGTNPTQENYVHGFSERLSNTFQLMIAKKMGWLSLELNPTIVTRGYALSYDEKTLFALGGAARIHLGGPYSLLLDISHTFRSKSSIDSFKVRNIRFYDAIGVGLEILTAGHVFHINFTNATDILENRYIPRTTSTWTKGQFRWGFTVARDFDLLWKKRRNK
ncbi:MAG: DUF5777 family beta-barrel protein [Chitinophagaceae bacterium]